MNSNFTTKIVATSFLALALSACSSGPSESDIKSVLEAGASEANAMGGSTFGGYKIHDVEKVGCEKVADKAYVCDVKIESTAPFVGKQNRTTKIRMVKTKDGWQPSM